MGHSKIEVVGLHWSRPQITPFGGLAYNPEQEREGSVAIEETLLALKELMDAGKIRSAALCSHAQGVGATKGTVREVFDGSMMRIHDFHAQINEFHGAQAVAGAWWPW